MKFMLNFGVLLTLALAVSSCHSDEDLATGGSRALVTTIARSSFEGLTLDTATGVENLLGYLTVTEANNSGRVVFDNQAIPMVDENGVIKFHELDLMLVPGKYDVVAGIFRKDATKLYHHESNNISYAAGDSLRLNFKPVVALSFTDTANVHSQTQGKISLSVDSLPTGGAKAHFIFGNTKETVSAGEVVRDIAEGDDKLEVFVDASEEYKFLKIKILDSSDKLIAYSNVVAFDKLKDLYLSFETKASVVSSIATELKLKFDFSAPSFLSAVQNLKFVVVIKQSGHKETEEITLEAQHFSSLFEMVIDTGTDIDLNEKLTIKTSILKQNGDALNSCEAEDIDVGPRRENDKITFNCQQGEPLITAKTAVILKTGERYSVGIPFVVMDVASGIEFSEFTKAFATLGGFENKAIASNIKDDFKVEIISTSSQDFPEMDAAGWKGMRLVYEWNVGHTYEFVSIPDPGLTHYFVRVIKEAAASNTDVGYACRFEKGQRNLLFVDTLLLNIVGNDATCKVVTTL